LQGKSARMAGAAFTSRSEGDAVGALSDTGWVVPFGAPKGAIDVGEKRRRLLPRSVLRVTRI
jgi:hypothetical protein